MRAWCLEDRIGPKGLSLKEIPDPEPSGGEFLLRIEGTALNRADLLQTKGLYAAPEAVHEIPGLEFVGTILEAGPSASLRTEDGRALGPGDRVIGLVAEGAWAERIAVSGDLLIPWPEEQPSADAGGIAECALTVFDALRRQGDLRRGQTVLVHAGSSGIGTMAQRIVAHYGARILTTCSSAKVEAVRAWGADLVVDYGQQDFAEEVRAFTEGAGVDLILDTLGGGALDANLRSLRSGGLMVTIGLLSGLRGELDLGRLLTRRLRLRGSVLRSRRHDEKAALVADFRREMSGALAAGTLSPCVDTRFAFEDIPDALHRLHQRAHVGKILIDLET